MSAAAFLEIRDLEKSFGDTRVLEGLDVAVEEGEILALLGLSGSGKTTALRLLAGFETAERGTIHVGGEEVSRLGPAARGFGMVFQHYALFPHMTVAENVAFGLEARGWSKERIAERIDEMLALVDLAGYGERKVSAISGGQQQRVALARALAPEPRLLLLDEPLSNLDPALRERTRRELREAVRRVGITTVLVTHEQEEAFHLGDRIAVLHRGRLQQVGSAADLYRRPATRFVAGFVGRSSALRGTVESIDASTEGDVARVRLAESTTTSSGVTWSGTIAEEARGTIEKGAAVDLVVRPESLELVDPAAGEATLETTLRGTVRELRFTGPLTYALLGPVDDPADDPAEAPVQVLVDGAAPAVGETVHVRLRASTDPPSGSSAGPPVPRVFPAGDDV